MPDRLWRVRAKRVIVAEGAIERPLVFTNNDRPGVMSADAGLTYLRRHDILVGERIVVAANNDTAYDVVGAMAHAGASVILADSRPHAQAAAVPDGVDVRHETAVGAVHGRNGVEAVKLGGETVPADCLLVAGGFTPSVHLFCQARGRLRYDEETLAFVPDQLPDGMAVAGAANGVFGLSRVLEDGHRAGSTNGAPPEAGGDERPYSVHPAWPDGKGNARQWIDFQNDVTVKDVALAARENYRSVEHLKRYTTLGMATDQGKTSNMNGLAAMAVMTGRVIPDVGTTTYRPPFVAVPLPVIGGRRERSFANMASG